MEVTLRPLKSQAARDAYDGGFSRRYAEYLDESAAETAAYYTARGDLASAERMFTRTLAEALAGNDGA